MPRIRRPRRGSKAYWPRIRADRMYPSVNIPVASASQSDKTAKPMAFAGYKAGMTRANIVDKNKNSPTFGQTIEIPITILDCPPLFVAGYRFYDSTPKGLKVLTEILFDKLPKNAARVMTIPKKKQEHKEPAKFTSIRLLALTQPEKSGFGKKTPEVFEVALSGDHTKQLEFAKQILGKEISAKDIFKDGEQIDTMAVTTGRGYEGPVKRFGVAIQDRHVKMKHRHIGTLGPEGQRRVRVGTIPYAGQMGFFTRTEYNKRIIKIGENGKEVTPASGYVHYGVVKSNYIILEGSVGGPKKRLITMRHGIRAKAPVAHELKAIKM